MRLVLIIFLLNQTITSAQNKLPNNWYLFYNIKYLENSSQVYKDPKIGISTTEFEKPKKYNEQVNGCAGEYLPEPVVDDTTAAEVENLFGI